MSGFWWVSQLNGVWQCLRPLEELKRGGPEATRYDRDSVASSRPGPTSPVNDWALETQMELSQVLGGILRDLGVTVESTGGLHPLLVRQVQALGDHVWLTPRLDSAWMDRFEEVVDRVRTRMQDTPPASDSEVKDDDDQPETARWVDFQDTWRTASGCVSLLSRAIGCSLPRKTVTSWGNAGLLDHRVNRAGHREYRVADVLCVAEQRGRLPANPCSC